MKILIAGSRSIKEFDLSPYVDEDIDLIVCGGARGIDAVAEKYADNNRISKLVLRPNYRKYGKAAPLKRNEQMVDIVDTVLVIWDGVSRGSAYTVEYAKKSKKPLIIVRDKEA